MNFKSNLSKRSIWLIAAGLMISAIVMVLAFTITPTISASLSGLQLILFVLLFPVLIKFAIQLVAVPFHFYQDFLLTNGLSDVATNTKVSVLIPAWNEEVGIIRTIQSVIDTNYTNLEIIVINDGSTDNTYSLVMDFIKLHKQGARKAQEEEVNLSLNIPDIKFVSLTNGGKARALNHGTRMASGEIVMTIDADSIMDHKMIQQMVLRFQDPKVGAVAGNVIVGNRSKPIEIIQQLEYLYGFFFKRADSVFGSVHIIGGAAAAYRRSALIEVGAFDENIITEDVEMSMRILKSGYKTLYAPNAVVFTEGPSEWNGLCNQRLRWKYGRILTFLKHKSLFFSQSRKHSPYLSWLILPISIYVEFVLLFEAVILGLFVTYLALSGNLFPLAILIGWVTTVISLQIALDSKRAFHKNLLIIAPIAWLLFYVIDTIECLALMRSLKRLYKRESLEWQKWVRVGLAQKEIVAKAD